jgi:serine/threonine protein kinase
MFVFQEILLKNHDRLYRLIKEKEFNQTLLGYTENTKEILTRLLELNPKKRIRVSECLKNKIFEGL